MSGWCWVKFFVPALLLSVVAYYLIKRYAIGLDSTESLTSREAGKSARDDDDAKKVTNDELKRFSSWIWDNDVNGIKNVMINVQHKMASNDHEDRSQLPLFTSVSQQVYKNPSFSLYVPLMDNYIDDVNVEENRTDEEFEEEWQFIDHVTNTTVIKRLYTFLQDKEYHDGSVPIGEFFHDFWFTVYMRKGSDRKKRLCSSAFEHVFIGERRAKNLLGLHNWFRYHRLEDEEKSNYFGYHQFSQLGSRSAINLMTSYVRTNVKPITGFFVGASPEAELAIYTLCFYVRPNGICNIEINRKKVGVQTYRLAEEDGGYLASAFPRNLPKNG